MPEADLRPGGPRGWRLLSRTLVVLGTAVAGVSAAWLLASGTATADPVEVSAVDGVVVGAARHVVPVVRQVDSAVTAWPGASLVVLRRTGLIVEQVDSALPAPLRPIPATVHNGLSSPTVPRPHDAGPAPVPRSEPIAQAATKAPAVHPGLSRAREFDASAHSSAPSRCPRDACHPASRLVVASAAAPGSLEGLGAESGHGSDTPQLGDHITSRPPRTASLIAVSTGDHGSALATAPSRQPGTTPD